MSQESSMKSLFGFLLLSGFSGLALADAAAPVPNKAPSILIFSSYGLALLLTILAIGFAAVRLRKSGVSVKE